MKIFENQITEVFNQSALTVTGETFMKNGAPCQVLKLVDGYCNDNSIVIGYVMNDGFNFNHNLIPFADRILENMESNHKSGVTVHCDPLGVYKIIFKFDHHDDIEEIYPSFVSLMAGLQLHNLV